MNALLDALGVSVRGPDGYLVEPISLTMRAGIPMTIVGETGSGKSLLLQALMGTLPAGLRAAGTATICADIFDLSAASELRKLWGRTISILPQEPWLALDPLMRSREQVAEVYRLVGSDTGASAHALADLKAVGLAAAETRLPGELSGGMAQRLAFSAARAGGGHLQFADEPTKGLDTSMRNDVANLLLGRLASTGGLLTVTHDLDLARRLGGEIMVMLEGKVVEHAPADRLFEAPSHAYTKRLIDAQPSNWSTRPTSAEPGPRVLSARKLSVERGGRKLFEGVDIDFAPGQLWGFTAQAVAARPHLATRCLGSFRRWKEKLYARWISPERGFRSCGRTLPVHLRARRRLAANWKPWRSYTRLRPGGSMICERSCGCQHPCLKDFRARFQVVSCSASRCCAL
jgi:ABC-type glutathione transport system ATPase component